MDLLNTINQEIDFSKLTDDELYGELSFLSSIVNDTTDNSIVSKFIRAIVELITRVIANIANKGKVWKTVKRSAIDEYLQSHSTFYRTLPSVSYSSIVNEKIPLLMRKDSPLGACKSEHNNFTRLDFNNAVDNLIDTVVLLTSQANSGDDSSYKNSCKSLSNHINSKESARILKSIESNIVTHAKSNVVELGALFNSVTEIVNVIDFSSTNIITIIEDAPVVAKKLERFYDVTDLLLEACSKGSLSANNLKETAKVYKELNITTQAYGNVIMETSKIDKFLVEVCKVIRSKN